MGVRVYESMTRVPIIAHAPNLRRGWDAVVKGCVRVWRSEESLAAACEPDNADIYAAVQSLGPDASKQAIIEAIEQLPRIAAVEVVGETGAGALLYPNWE